MKMSKRIKISNLSFALKFDDIKRIFILKSPTAKNIEFKEWGDVLKFMRNNYPRFVNNKFKNIFSKEVIE